MKKSIYVSQRACVSLLNITIVYILVELLCLFLENYMSKWFVFTILYFSYLTVCMIFFDNVNLGMYFFNSQYVQHYSYVNHTIYNIFYTLSASTIYLKAFFFLDMFFLNMFLIQCMCLVLKGNTLHALISKVHVKNTFELKDSLA